MQFIVKLFQQFTLWARIENPIPIFIDDQKEKRFLYGGSVHTVNNDSIYASLLVYVILNLRIWELH